MAKVKPSERVVKDITDETVTKTPAPNGYVYQY
mgnify:FL=1